MSFRASGGRASGCWAFGVFGWDGDAFHPGDHLWGYPGDCVNQPGGWTYFAGPYALDLRGHQKVRMGVRCESAAGCATSSMETWANLKDVSVTVRDDSAPSLSATGGELLGDGWHRGTEWMWAAVRDNVGIRSVYGQLDGNGAFASQDFAEPGWPASVACDFARPRPCADLGSAGLPLDTRTAADGVHALRFVGIDAAGNAASLDRTIAVDNHAPAPPRAVTVSGGEGWRAAGPFDVSWTNPPGQTAPIARVHWRLCRGGACEQGSRDGAAVSSLEGLRVAGAGDWTLALWLEDEAGNADAAQAAEPVHLRLDDVAPSTGGFELQDPADPRRVSLVASDAHSGLAGARIELRERSGGAWRALPTALAADGRAVARIPDAELPDGTYELRALVRDAVGNETVADRDVTGRPMVVVLPLRLATRIVGRSSAARRCRTVRRKVGRRTVRGVCAARRLRLRRRPCESRCVSASGARRRWPACWRRGKAVPSAAPWSKCSSVLAPSRRGAAPGPCARTRPDASRGASRPGPRATCAWPTTATTFCFPPRWRPACSFPRPEPCTPAAVAPATGRASSSPAACAVFPSRAADAPSTSRPTTAAPGAPSPRPGPTRAAGGARAIASAPPAAASCTGSAP